MGEIGTDEKFGDRPREHCIYIVFPVDFIIKQHLEMS
jgi:hypothetical protein